MKRYLFYALFCLLVPIVGSCSDDDTPVLTGTLSIKLSHGDPVKFKICAFGDKDENALYETVVTVESSLKLNMGNYLLVPENYYGNAAFQIRPNEITYIKYRSDGAPVVE